MDKKNLYHQADSGNSGGPTVASSRKNDAALIESLQKRLTEADNQLEAIAESNAVVEFNLDGSIISANKNFLHVMTSYTLEEIKGKHHRIFVEDTYRASGSYIEFWSCTHETCQVNNIITKLIWH